MRKGKVKKKTKEGSFDRMEVLRKSNEGIITRHKSSVNIKDITADLSVSSKTATAGITLIALVITIIVLLILAAVSVVTLTGENGILRQAGNAKEETRGASVEEARDLWKINQEADNYTENRIAQTLSELLDDLKNQKLITEEERKTIDATGKVTIGSRTIVFEETLAEKIVPTNYGDYINYSVDLGIDGDKDGDTADIDDWRIFYKNESGNVFIIAADYVPNTNTLLSSALSKAGMTVSGTYNAYWSTIPDYTVVDSNIASLFRFGYSSTSDYSSSTSNDNMKAVSKLLDTNIWSTFATGVNDAKAIGGATLEMYVASWNEKGYTPLYCNNSTSIGEYIGINDFPTTTVVNMQGKSGYNDTLYYPHRAGYNSCCGYWLASPSADSESDLNTSSVDYYGQGGGPASRSYSSTVESLRPVVCLPSGIKGNQGADGIWTIQE